jgi:hypothetical protein
VGGQRRGNILLNDTTHADAVATLLSSTMPVVVERPYYLGKPNGRRTGATLVYGRNGTGQSWLFPAGDTTGGRREELLVLNPNARRLAVRAVFYRADGRTVTHTFTVPAAARYTLDVSAVRGVGTTRHGSMLTAMNGLGFVAEQTVYNAARTSVYGAAGLAQ